MNYRHVLAVGAVLFFAVQMAHAQATLDILRELDKELEAKEPEGAAEGAVLEQLAENIGGKLRLRGRMFLSRPSLSFMGLSPTEYIEVDRRSTFGEAMLQFDTHTGKKDVWRLNFAGWAEYGNDRDRWAGVFKWMQDDYHRSSIIELNEVYLTLFQDTFNFTAGKKILKNGISTIYSPANRYTSGDINDPLYPKEFGIWQAKADVMAGESTTISGAILPVYQRPKIPGAQSRWFGASEDFDFRLMEIPDWVQDSVYQRERVGIEMDNVSYLGSVKTALDGWDLFASAYHGNNAYFTFDGIGGLGALGDEALLTKTVTRVNNYAVGFSTTHKQVEFHGEALYNDSCGNRDDDYISTVIGMTCTSNEFAQKLLLQQIVATVEYAVELQTRERERDYQDIPGVGPATLDFSSSFFRLGRGDVIANAMLDVNDDFGFRILSHNDFRNGGHLQRFGARYKPLDNLAFTLDYNMLSGSPWSYYGLWKKNDMVVLTAEYSF